MRHLGPILMLAGLCAVGYGVASALGEIIGLYERTFAAPLEPTEERDGAMIRGIWRGLAIGLAGAPLLVAGSWLHIAARRRRRRMRREREAGLDAR